MDDYEVEDGENSSDYLVSSVDVDRFLHHKSRIDKAGIDLDREKVQRRADDSYSPLVGINVQRSSAGRYAQYEPSSDEELSPSALPLSRNDRLRGAKTRGRDIEHQSAHDSLSYSETDISSSSLASAANLSSTSDRLRLPVVDSLYSEEDHYPPPPPPLLGSELPSSSSHRHANRTSTTVSALDHADHSKAPDALGSPRSRPPLSTRPISQAEDRERRKRELKEMEKQEWGNAVVEPAVDEEESFEEEFRDIEEEERERNEVHAHNLSGEIYDYAEELVDEDRAGVEHDDYEEEGENDYQVGNADGNTSSESILNPLALSADDSITMIHKYFN